MRAIKDPGIRRLAATNKIVAHAMRMYTEGGVDYEGALSLCVTSLCAQVETLEAQIAGQADTAPTVRLST